MLIEPSDRDFAHWINCVPTAGDLLFFWQDMRELDLPVPVVSAEQVRAQAIEVWKLNDRSWYGYALNTATHAAWFPSGILERLNDDLRDKLAFSQIKLKVPTLVTKTFIPANLRLKLPRFGQHFWLTTAAWQGLNRQQKMAAIKSWFLQNEIKKYETLKFQDLSQNALKELKRLKLNKIVNRYPSTSGANCFGAVAGITASAWQSKMMGQWTHWPTLEGLLAKRNFSKVKSQAPRKGDVLVFLRKETAVHAAYLLEGDIYFEKPGQDFYEPYRLVQYHKWKQEWPNSKLVIYRKV